MGCSGDGRASDVSAAHPHVLASALRRLVPGADPAAAHRGRRSLARARLRALRLVPGRLLVLRSHALPRRHGAVPWLTPSPPPARCSDRPVLASTGQAGTSGPAAAPSSLEGDSARPPRCGCRVSRGRGGVAQCTLERSHEGTRETTTQGSAQGPQGSGPGPVQAAHGRRLRERGRAVLGVLAHDVGAAGSSAGNPGGD